MQSRRSYQHAMNEFIAWYCSEPRLALNRIVVLRYRMHLENIPLAPATINLRLAAIRRLAYEAADNGFLSPELVAGTRRVKGVKRLGQQVGNWLTAEEGQQVVGAVRTDTLRGKRDAAMLGLLLGCGLRRSDPLNLMAHPLAYEAFYKRLQQLIRDTVPGHDVKVGDQRMEHGAAGPAPAFDGVSALRGTPDECIRALD